MKQIQEAILSNVLLPLARRLGSTVGAALIALDMAPDQVVQVEVAIGALAAFVFDLITSNRFPRVRK